MAENAGLICAVCLDRAGGGSQLDWEHVRRWQETDGPLWVHLDRGHEVAVRWIESDAGVNPVVADALCAEETRPRCTAVNDGLVLILRGVNLNPGADPEDMVSLRLWTDGKRVVSVQMRKVMAIEDVRAKLAEKRGPTGPGDLVVEIADRLVERMGPTLADIDDQIDNLEEEIVAGAVADLRGGLANLRQKAIVLRRYIAPQRDALGRLQAEPAAALSDTGRLHLREISDAVTRYVEDLDAARERAAVVQDQIANRIAEEMNRRMYLLSVVAAIFLPLGLITGLLGINVGGIPGADTPWAFGFVTFVLVLIAAAQIFLFRRSRLL
jgi:zinc transporter